VILHGVARFAEDPEEIARVSAAYAAKYGDRPPEPDANPLVAIRPAWVFGLVESAFTTSPTRWLF
jgi:hypothetical protein